MRWRIRCRRCDRILRVPLGVRSHWHRCEPKRKRSVEPLVTLDEIRSAAWQGFGERGGP